MNLRRTAALVLVGWYLMVPPAKSSKTLEADFNAPLGQWSILRSFDAADACEKAKADFQKKSPEPPAGGKVTISLLATCIATDDPRLKGN
jgi:hypothetical protein